jgi:hypothetical protein
MLAFVDEARPSIENALAAPLPYNTIGNGWSIPEYPGWATVKMDFI